MTFAKTLFCSLFTPVSYDGNVVTYLCCRIKDTSQAVVVVFLQHQPLLAFVADLELFDSDGIRLEVFFVAPCHQLTSYAF